MKEEYSAAGAPDSWQLQRYDVGHCETPEMRACAALGLGRIRHASAERALTAAAAEADPVVRSAVGRALRNVKT